MENIMGFSLGEFNGFATSLQVQQLMKMCAQQFFVKERAR